MEQVNILFAGFVDDEADASKRKALMDNLKLGSAGTKGHARDACDNPGRCDSKLE